MHNLAGNVATMERMMLFINILYEFLKKCIFLNSDLLFARRFQLVYFSAPTFSFLIGSNGLYRAIWFWGSIR
jgi:hypothetical protein